MVGSPIHGPSDLDKLEAIAHAERWHILKDRLKGWRWRITRTDSGSFRGQVLNRDGATLLDFSHPSWGRVESYVMKVLNDARQP
jgi:hypothetical protein